jgi:small conductance mechanosensitive channel
MTDTALDEYDKRQAAIKEAYEYSMISEVSILGALADTVSNRMNNEILSDIATESNLDGLYLLDMDGSILASGRTGISLTDINFSLSGSAFKKLLYDAGNVVDYKIKDERVLQVAGIPLINDSGIRTGVMIGIKRADAILTDCINDDHSIVVRDLTDDQGSMILVVNKNGNTVTYDSEDILTGLSYTESGIEKEALKDGYNGYMTINDVRYRVNCLAGGNEYILLASGQGEGGSVGNLVTVIVVFIYALNILLIYLVMSDNLRLKKISQLADNKDLRNLLDKRGRLKAIQYDRKNILGTYLRVVVALLSIGIILAVIISKNYRLNGSVVWYVLNSEWEKGFNIMSFTSILVIMCIGTTISQIIQYIFSELAGNVGSRGETLCKMSNSLIKYALVIGIIYYSLSMVGIHTETLLASAGILSLIVGLGANQLIGDILSGLFIIIEGEFQVGDIVKLGEFRGTVVEIGVRTTKLVDDRNNTKIVNNSQISDIVNMTKNNSLAVCEIPIDYMESIERVEAVLMKEFPKLQKEIPSISRGPFYRGVSKLGDNGVILKIVAECREADRFQTERDLNRRLKIIFDENNISIPFNQVVVHEPTDYTRASVHEKAVADRFYEKQDESDVGHLL